MPVVYLQLCKWVLLLIYVHAIVVKLVHYAGVLFFFLTSIVIVDADIVIGWLVNHEMAYSHRGSSRLTT